jgi:hypothetical protein
MKQLIVALIFVTLAGCASNRGTVQIKWPDAPTELLEPSEDLVPLAPEQTQLSDLLDNANTNYTKYYNLKDRYDAWQSWYNTQKTIHDGLTK